jgi:hypothetical protein
MIEFVYITLENNQDPADRIDLKFRLHNHSLAQRWAAKVVEASQFCEIDDKDRFYHFPKSKWTTDHIVTRLNETIALINEQLPLIERTVTDINDQDTLNYLHHVFEERHGLLDEWKTNPRIQATFAIHPLMRNWLSDLNNLIHRAENQMQGKPPRPSFVATWYAMPKNELLEDSDYELFTRQYKFGEIYVNYCDVGKQLENLYRDNDAYINEDAFVPHKHFSADCAVLFYDTPADEAASIVASCWDYFNKHNRNPKFQRGDKKITIGKPPVASLETSKSQQEVINEISNHQYISSFNFV